MRNRNVPCGWAPGATLAAQAFIRGRQSDRRGCRVRYGCRGLPVRAPRAFMPVVQIEQQLADVAAVNSMASVDISGRNARRAFGG